MDVLGVERGRSAGLLESPELGQLALEGPLLVKCPWICLPLSRRVLDHLFEPFDAGGHNRVEDGEARAALAYDWCGRG